MLMHSPSNNNVIALSHKKKKVVTSWVVIVAKNPENIYKNAVEYFLKIQTNAALLGSEKNLAKI